MRTIAVLVSIGCGGCVCDTTTGPCPPPACETIEGTTYHVVYEITEEDVCKRGLTACDGVCSAEVGCE